MRCDALNVQVHHLRIGRIASIRYSGQIDIETARMQRASTKELRSIFELLSHGILVAGTIELAGCLKRRRSKLTLQIYPHPARTWYVNDVEMNVAWYDAGKRRQCDSHAALLMSAGVAVA
jgi:hypothetical protein